MGQYEHFIENEPQRISPGDINRILEHCVNLNSSDITIQNDEPIVAEIYGRLHHITQHKLNYSEVSEILNGIYGPNGTTQLLSGTDLDHYYEYRATRDKTLRFRINATACLIQGHTGIQITLRSIPDLPPPLSDMNLPQNLLDAITPSQGVIYVTGATGSGKSTLLASIVRSIIEDPEAHRKVLTYESPIEFTYDKIKKITSIVSQSEIPLHLPSFEAGIRNALRRKPRLILVGEARDKNTIAAVIEAALTGHPVYTTLHSNGVAESVRRLVGSFPSEERQGRALDIIETVRAIVWQKLVPSVDGKRVALREYLIFTPEIRDKLMEVDATKVTSQARMLLEKHGQTMAIDAKKKHKEGVISDELYKKLIQESKSLHHDAHHNAK
jgi:defect in organelle trafficking protein DotB